MKRKVIYNAVIVSNNTHFFGYVVIDGEIITVFVDNKIALTTRMIAMVENNFSFYSNNCEALFSNIKFYE